MPNKGEDIHGSELTHEVSSQEAAMVENEAGEVPPVDGAVHGVDGSADLFGVRNRAGQERAGRAEQVLGEQGLAGQALGEQGRAVQALGEQRRAGQDLGEQGRAGRALGDQGRASLGEQEALGTPQGARSSCKEICSAVSGDHSLAPFGVTQDLPDGGSGHSLRPRKMKHKSQLIPDDDRSKVSTLSSSLNSDDDISRLISTYDIPPTVSCRRAEKDEFACDGSSGDLVIYEEMLEVGFRFPMSHPICQIMHYFSLTPGQLAPNGWRVLLGFLMLWRKVHHEDASPKEFHGVYNLSETPSPNRGWYYFTAKSGMVLTGLRSNCHG